MVIPAGSSSDSPAMTPGPTRPPVLQGMCDERVAPAGRSGCQPSPLRSSRLPPTGWCGLPGRWPVPPPAGSAREPPLGRSRRLGAHLSQPGGVGRVSRGDQAARLVLGERANQAPPRGVMAAVDGGGGVPGGQGRDQLRRFARAQPRQELGESLAVQAAEARRAGAELDVVPRLEVRCRSCQSTTTGVRCRANQLRPIRRSTAPMPTSAAATFSPLSGRRARKRSETRDRRCSCRSTTCVSTTSRANNSSSRSSGRSRMCPRCAACVLPARMRIGACLAIRPTGCQGSRYVDPRSARTTRRLTLG